MGRRRGFCLDLDLDVIQNKGLILQLFDDGESLLFLFQMDLLVFDFDERGIERRRHGGLE